MRNKNNIHCNQRSKPDDNLLFQSLIIKCEIDLQITNIYKESDFNLNPRMPGKLNIFNNTQQLVLGDLNIQDAIWGSSVNSTSGRRWDNFANEKNLIVLNDGSPTLFSTRNTLTAIEVTMSSVDLAPKLSWRILDLPPVADHFPKLITNSVL